MHSISTPLFVATPPPLPTPREIVATTDPAAATDTLNLLEDSFAAFLRTSRTTTRPSTISPRLPPHYNPSPRLPSALPPSASPNLLEPVTPDRSVLPFYSDSDTAGLQPHRSAAQEAAREAERLRRIEWARSLPALSTRPNSIGVVDEAVADDIFSSVPRRPSSNRRAPTPPIPALSAPDPTRLPIRRPARSPLPPSSAPHPAMHLELAPLRPATTATTNTQPAPPPLSPHAWGAVDTPTVLPSPLPPAFGRPTEPYPPPLWPRQPPQSQQQQPRLPDLPELFIPARPPNPDTTMTTPPPVEPVLTPSNGPIQFGPAPGLAGGKPPSPGMPSSLAAFLGSTSSISAEEPSISKGRPPRRRRVVADGMVMCDSSPGVRRDGLSAMSEDVAAGSAGGSAMLTASASASLSSAQQSANSAALSAGIRPRARSSRPRTAPDGMDAVVRGATLSADPLQCHLCSQRFARRSNLFKHLRSVHEERRRFACSICPFKFKRQDHLLKHTRSVHAKVRKFSCDICGIGFAEKFNRDKHTRSIHYTKRPFQCPCGAYFQDRDKMLGCLRCKSAPSF